MKVVYGLIILDKSGTTDIHVTMLFLVKVPLVALLINFFIQNKEHYGKMAKGNNNFNVTVQHCIYSSQLNHDSTVKYVCVERRVEVPRTSPDPSMHDHLTLKHLRSMLPVA